MKASSPHLSTNGNAYTSSNVRASVNFYIVPRLTIHEKNIFFQVNLSVFWMNLITVSVAGNIFFYKICVVAKLATLTQPNLNLT